MKVRTALAAAAALLISASGATAQTQLSNVLSKYDMTVYGRVKVDFNFDTVEFRRFNDFLGAVGAGEDHENESTNFNPRDSRFGFAIARKGEMFKSEARIETDFYGSVSGSTFAPRLRLGYVKASHNSGDYNLLIGQDWTPVGSLHPPMIDFGVMSAAGNLWNRLPQATLRVNADVMEYVFSVLRRRRASTDEIDNVPWLMGKVGYTQGGLYTALGGGWQPAKIEDAGGNEETVTRWFGVMELKVSEGPLTFLLEPWIGEGVDSDLLRIGLGVNETTGEPEAMMGWGGFASVIYKLADDIAIASGYGLDNPEDDDLQGIELGDGTFELNQMAFVNAWYDWTEAIKVGGEVIYVRTDRGDDQENDGFRVTASTVMSF